MIGKPMDAGFTSWFLQLTYIAPSMFYDIPSRCRTFSPIKWRKSSLRLLGLVVEGKYIYISGISHMAKVLHQLDYNYLLL